MIYFLALIPATALAVAGYLVLFVSNRSEGSLRTFGRYLGFWAFTLAGLVILGAIFAAAHGARHGGMMGDRGLYGHPHDPWPGEPRFCAPRMEGPPGGDRPGDAQRGSAPATEQIIPKPDAR
jgi:hypothetical protein